MKAKLGPYWPHMEAQKFGFSGLKTALPRLEGGAHGNHEDPGLPQPRPGRRPLIPPDPPDLPTGS